MKRKIHSCSIGCFSNFYEDLKSYNGGNVTDKLYFWDTASIDKLVLLFLSSVNVYKHFFLFVYIGSRVTPIEFLKESLLYVCVFFLVFCVLFLLVMQI